MKSSAHQAIQKGKKMIALASLTSFRAALPLVECNRGFFFYRIRKEAANESAYVSVMYENRLSYVAYQSRPMLAM